MKTEYHLTIPKPLLVVIEDVGWCSGLDESLKNRPYRTGMKRRHHLEDYEAIAFLGQKLGTQILTGFVLCEWDRGNLLRGIPTSTWQGSSWDNQFKKSPLLDQAAAVVTDNSEFIEIALHGVGHEFWAGGELSRSEFHNQHGHMRERENVIAHIEAFHKLLKQSGIKAPIPTIFIPPALKHSFGDGENGIQKILSEFGIGFVLTALNNAKQYMPPLYDNFTRECGVTIIERGRSPVQWNAAPSEPCFHFKWPILPLHWGNILHNDPLENLSITKKWSDYIKRGVSKNGMVLLPDVSETLTQIIYSQLAEIRPIKNGFFVDLKKVRSVLPCDLDQGFYIKKTPGMKRINTIYGGEDIKGNQDIGEGYFKIKTMGPGPVRLLFT